MDSVESIEQRSGIVNEDQSQGDGDGYWECDIDLNEDDTCEHLPGTTSSLCASTSSNELVRESPWERVRNPNKGQACHSKASRVRVFVAIGSS